MPPDSLNRLGRPTGSTGKTGSTAVIDVRDMLCAQALAVVAQAMERLAPGGALRVTYNTDDVRRDLVLWVRERGDALLDMDATTLRIRRGRP